MPIGIDIEMLQYGYIIVQSWVSNVNVNEEALVVNNDCVVHWINNFPIVEPSLVHHIIPQLVDFHQGSVNEPNATWEVSNPPCQLTWPIGKPTNFFSWSCMVDDS